MPGGAPTPQDIGLPQIAGPRQVAGYDVSGYAQGAEALARSGQQLGAGIEHAGQEIGQEEMYRARNQALLTQDQLLGDAIQYRDQAKRNPALTPDEYNAGLDELVNKHIGNVPAGPMRDHALARTQIPIAREKASFNDQYQALQTSNFRAGIDDEINDVINTTGMHPDPLHQAKMEQLATKIDIAAQQGLILPTEREKLARRMVQGVYDTSYLRRLRDPSERAAAMAELQEAQTKGLASFEGVTPQGGLTLTGGAPSSSAAPVAPGRGASVSSTISAWRNAGMPDQAIAGVLHNIREESNFDSTLRHPDQPNWGGEAHFAHGLYQEGGAEWNHYQSWLGANHPGADWRDPNLQSQFAAWNLKTNYPDTWAKMASARTPEQAASIYASEYLRPALPNLRDRIARINARGVAPLNAYSSGTLSPSVPQEGGVGRGEAPSGNSAQDFLPPHRIDVLLNEGHRLGTAEIVDQERFLREQEKAEKLRVESVKDEYHKDIFGAQPTKTLTQAESDPRLDGYPEAREWIRAAFERAGRGDPVHTTSQKTSNEFERRMDLAWGDPEKLTDLAEIRKAHYGDPANGVAPTLSNSDAEHLEKRFNDMRTGDGNTWNQNLGEVMKAVTPKVEKLPIPLGLVDTDAPERMYKFRRKVEDLRQQYIKANKDPSDLLNPNKPDYVGRQEFIQPFAADRNALIAKLVGNKAEELKDDQPNAPLPEAPAGVDKKGWADIVSRPPLKQDGKPWARSAWAAYFDAFRQGNPTDADKAMFNQRFSTPNHPVDFDEMNARLGGKPPQATAPGTAPTAVHGPSAATAAGALTGSALGPVNVGTVAAPSPAPAASPAPPENETPEARRQRFETEAGVEAQRQSAEETQQRIAREARLAETRRAAQEQIAGRKTMRAQALAEGAQAFNERRAQGAADAAKAHLDELTRQEALLADNIKTWRAQQEDRSAAPGDRNRAALRADKLESELAAVRAERAKLAK